MRWRTSNVYERCRAEAVELALVLAHALVGECTMREPQALEHVMWKAIENVPASDEAVLRCHPDDLDIIASHLPTVTARRGDLLEIKVVASPAIERGGVVIDFSGGSVDGQPSTSLDVLREAIVAALAGSPRHGNDESSGKSDGKNKAEARP